MTECIIETKRLILRHWQEEDAEDLFRYAQDPDIGPAAGWQPHNDVEESRNIIKEIFSSKETYAVCLKESNKAIGSIGLLFSDQSNVPLDTNEVELGYWIGKPFWGQGLIPEAANALLHRAFHDLGITKVWCSHYENNIKSKRVIEKCGFTYEYTREDVFVPFMNERRTAVVYGLSLLKFTSVELCDDTSMARKIAKGTQNSSMNMREMRRKRQELSHEASEAILRKATSGVLAVNGDDGYPYAVPVSFVYQGGRIFFHSAKSGHKVDAITRNSKVSFCVIETDDVKPEEFTTYFRSVIAFGKAAIIETTEEKIAALKLFVGKYSPGVDGFQTEVDKSFDHMIMVRMDIEHLSGKEAIELVTKQ